MSALATSSEQKISRASTEKLRDNLLNGFATVKKWRDSVKYGSMRGHVCCAAAIFRRRGCDGGEANMFASFLRRFAGPVVVLTLALFAATAPASAGWWHGGGGMGGWHGGGGMGGWHGGWRGGYGGWRGGYGGWYGWGPGLGFLGGALVGSAIASYPYSGYYGDPYYGYGSPYPYPGYGNHGCVGYQVTYDQHGHVLSRRRVSIC
jgi:hypothetical protein